MTLVIASFVTMPCRVANIGRVVDSLLAQTVRPDKILVHYSADACNLDAGWSEPPVIHGSDHSIVKLRCVPNVGSCRKYLFVAQEFRLSDAFLILIDDDRTWEPHVFERLIEFADRTGCVATTRGWSDYRLKPDRDGNLILHDEGIKASNISVPTAVAVANSGWATCFRPSSVRMSLFDSILFERAQMSNSDEIILSAMLDSPRYVVPMPKQFYADLSAPMPLWQSPAATRAKLVQLRLSPNLGVRLL